MAILFHKKKKKEIYLAIFAGVLLLVLIFILVKPKGDDPQETVTVGSSFLEQSEKNLQIDFTKLEILILKDLQPFVPISPYQQGFGRENPFAPYTSVSTSGTSTLPE